jgi:anti-sigma-K factor RskA
MRYESDSIRDALAAEYVVGTLRGPARWRFERALKSSPPLRRTVAVWQEMLAPLDRSIEAVTPPVRVWRTIQLRIGAVGGRRRDRLETWSSVRFWRAAAAVSGAVALLLGVWLTSVAWPLPAPQTMVAVLADEGLTPVLVVSWNVRSKGAQRLRVRVARNPGKSTDGAWELWMVPRGGGGPVSLGLVTTHEMQIVTVPARLTAAVNAAWGLAMTVEPRGGSPTGRPTGTALYKGPCTLL